MGNTSRSLKAKVVSKLPTSSSRENKQRLKNVCAKVIPGLEATLRIVKEAAGPVGCPGMMAGIGGLLFIIDIVKVIPYLTYKLPLLIIYPAENKPKRMRLRATVETYR
jgi:hypothetical protein